MKSKFWHAIDLIGYRPVAKMEWETVCGLAWAEICPFLIKCPGRAEEVTDPDDRQKQLVVWENSNGTAVLESQEFPAHRLAIERPLDDVTLFRPDIRRISSALALQLGFIIRPVDEKGSSFGIGFVQTPGVSSVEVILIMPSTPGAVRLAGQRILMDCTKKKFLILLPTAKLFEFLPTYPANVVVRFLAEFLAHSSEDSLVNVTMSIAEPLGKPSQKAMLNLAVRQEDRWSDLVASFNPSCGLLELRIQRRSITVRIWDTRKKVPSNDALILGTFASKMPASWTISDVPLKNQRAMSKAFQRLQRKIKDLVPLADGEPFEYDSSTHCHHPRFKLILKK